MGKLTNGIGIFVLTLWRDRRRFVNAKLHPMPSLNWTRTANITVFAAAVRRRPRRGGGERQARRVLRHRPTAGRELRDGSAVRFLQITMEVMAHDPKADRKRHKNIPLIRTIAAADEQSQLSDHDVA